MANIPMDENLAAIIVGSMYVVGYSLSSWLVSRIPRRSLLIGSLFLMMIANLGTAVFLLYADSNSDTTLTNETKLEIEMVLSEVPRFSLKDQILGLVPLISCVLLSFGYSCGLGPVPFILIGELFPSKSEITIFRCACISRIHSVTH